MKVTQGCTYITKPLVNYIMPTLGFLSWAGENDVLLTSDDEFSPWHVAMEDFVRWYNHDPFCKQCQPEAQRRQPCEERRVAGHFKETASNENSS